MTCLVKSFAKTTQEALMETLKKYKICISYQKLYLNVVTYSDEQLRKKKKIVCIIIATARNRFNWKKYI